MFCFSSFKRLEIVSISRVKPANMLMVPSLPITSEMLRLLDPPLGSSSFEGGTRMLGMFMMGFWVSRDAALAGLLRKKFGRRSCAEAMEA